MPAHLPPVEPFSDAVHYLSGDVVVDANAGVAPGVLLQADPGSRIDIAAGVCIGMGSIVHALDGSISIEAGATLGTGVLVIGQGVIGARACIGSSSTVFNTSVESHQVIPPGSLIGGEQKGASGDAREEDELEAPDLEDALSEEGPVPELSEDDSALPPSGVDGSVSSDTDEDAHQVPEAHSNGLVKRTAVPGYTQLNQLLGKIYSRR